MSGLLQLAEVQPDAIEPSEIPYGEWLPDQPTVNNPGAVEALNVIPADGSYVPFPQLETLLRSTIVKTVRGAASVIDENDVTQIYAGTIDGVYSKLSGSEFDVVKGNAPASDEYNWQFIRVNEQMVLVHPQNIPSRTPIGSVTLATVLGGTPPTAFCGAQVGDFLMLGHLAVDPDDGGGAFPSRVRWSGFNNIDSPWVTDPVTRADFQDMPPKGGPVVAIAGGEVGVIFQARKISIARPVATTEIFSITHVEERGAIARDSVVDLGAYKFFIAEDGFFTWNGTNSAPIGDGRVNKYFFNRLEFSRRGRIAGAVDYVNGCILWAFPTDTSGALTEIIIYSYRDNKWSHSIQTLEYLFSSAASNVTLEDLADPLESYDFSFDDPILRRGGRSQLAAFDITHTYGLFSGLPMAATIDTGEYSGPNNRRVFVNKVRPLVNLATPLATVQTAMRDQMIGQPVVFSDPVAQELDGACPILADARYMRFRTNIPMDTVWDHATGVEVFRKAGGEF